jgi:hypothetical protein
MVNGALLEGVRACSEARTCTGCRRCRRWATGSLPLDSGQYFPEMPSLPVAFGQRVDDSVRGMRLSLEDVVSDVPRACSALHRCTPAETALTTRFPRIVQLNVVC